MEIVHGIADRVRRGELSERARNFAPTVAEQLAALTPEARAAVEDLINRLFRDIRDSRPAWRQAWSTKEAIASAKAAWVTAFIEGGITDWDRQVELGLRRLRAEKSDFVPSPGKFIGWCQPMPEDFGLPEVEAAYAEACRKAHPAQRQSVKWTHPAVYHAATDVGLDNLMMLPRETSLQLFERSYVVMCRRCMTGASLGGGVALGIGHESHKSAAQIAEERSEQQAMAIRELQGIPQDGQAARRALLKAVCHREAV